MTGENEVDPAAQSATPLARLIANYERLKQTKTATYARLVAEQACRRDKGLVPDRSIAFLKQAARANCFVSYGNVAEANGVPWSKVRNAMNGAHGHLDKLMAICHAQGLPLLTAICVNRANLSTGTLDATALKGFADAARRLDLPVADEAAFLRESQYACFAWGKTSAGHE